MAQTLPRPLALSPSRVNDYENCPLKYRLRAIDRLEEPETLAQVKGTLVHAVLETMHQWPREERTFPAAVKQLKPHWETLCQQAPTRRTLVPEEDFYPFLVECRDLLRGYFLMENPQGFDATACEAYVEDNFDGVPVRGYIDRIDIAPTGEVRLVDYKTGKKPAPRFQQSAVFQMRFYALVYWRQHDHIPEQLRLMYLKKADSLYLQPRPAELNATQRTLERVWEAIRRDGEAGNFRPKRNALCNWCSFQALCPAFDGTPPEYPGWPDSQG